MTVHPFPQRPGSPRPEPVASVDDPLLGGLGEELDEDLLDLLDVDESLCRFGSFDISTRLAHRAITPPLLTALTGIQLLVCREYHFVLFTLLERIGRHDGLVATPTLLIGASTDRFETATTWLADHPAPDVTTMLDEAPLDERPQQTDRRIDAAIADHSRGLASAAGSSPSLTFGSEVALAERLVDDILEIAISCQPTQMQALTTTSLAVLGRLPPTTRIPGGAVVRTRS